jgi:hypothetical protein
MWWKAKGGFRHPEDAEKVGIADKDLPCLRAAVHVAQEVGARLGQCEVLFRSLQAV